jgi:anaerobic magnesium-protoporphyrin IX monomethyl ester cyclase
VIRHSQVLVAHAYYLAYDSKQAARMRPYPPLATLIAAAMLRRAGLEVAFFDAMLAAGTTEFRDCLRERRPAVVCILEDNFNYLTKMCTIRMREAAFDMIAAAREAGCRVAVNGSDASDHPMAYLAAGADAVVLGETEQTVPELVRRWLDDPRDQARDIPGLGLAGSNGHPRFVRTPERAFVGDLDALPLPAWDLIDVDRYRAAWMEAHGRFSWNAVTTRGCPYHCNWCAKPLYGSRYAQRSPENVVEELVRLRAEVDPDHVWFADDIFGLSFKWIERFGEAVARADARVPFTIQSRVNLMSPTAVDALARAGAEEVWLGVESGSQRILDAMDKGTSVDQVRLATRRLRERGIRACWFLQLGYSGEEWPDLLRTRDLVREERPDDVGISVSYPLPGTVFYERVKAGMGKKRNWRESNDLAMMFRGAYDTAFYRAVRDLLHDEVSRAATADHLEARWHDLAGSRYASPAVDRGP